MCCADLPLRKVMVPGCKGCSELTVPVVSFFRDPRVRRVRHLGHKI